MKFTTTTDNLQTALRKVSNSAAKKDCAQPLLATIMVEASSGNVRLHATDGDIFTTAALNAAVLEDGRTAIPAKNFCDIVNTQQAGDVEISCDEGGSTLKFTCHKVKYSINVLKAADFPPAPAFNEECAFTVEGRELVDNIKHVAYARSNDDARKGLDGIYFLIEDGVWVVVASDAKRLALVEHALQNPVEVAGNDSGAAEAATGAGSDVPAVERRSFILPPRTAMEVISIVDQSKPVRVRMSQSSVVFENDTTVMYSKLMPFTYPNFRSVIPNSFMHQVSIPRALFHDVLKRAEAVAGSSDKSVTLDIQSAQMGISTSSDSGSFIESIDVELEGEPVKIAVSPTFLDDPLKVMGCDKIVIKYNNACTPIEVTGEPGFIYILMPMRD